MPVTTEQCRAFIADFEKRNPQIEEARFGSGGDEEDDEVQAATCNPKNWKRLHKTRPEQDFPYMFYVDGQSVNYYAEPSTSISESEIAWVRGFTCVPSEGQIGYLVLEKHDGTLLLGNYIGD